MRILVVIYEYPPIGGGGGQAAKDICQGLVNRGHEVHVITSHINDLPRLETIHGVLVVRVPSARQVAFQAGILPMSGFVLAGTCAAFKHIRNWRPDLIHVHFAVPSGPVAWAVSRRKGIPYILTAHLGDVPTGVPEKTDHWFRWIYPFTPVLWRDASRIVAVSEFTRQLAMKHYPVNPQVIPNGVDLAALNPGEINVGPTVRIIFAGRFMPQKNPIQLVRTLASLKQLDWECVMLGDGQLRSEIEREIHNQDLTERFTLPGWVSSQEVIDWFKQSDILFMPSLSEGLPVVGVQALAMGLGIVASKIGGFIELVDNGINGYLVETTNPSGYHHALEGLISNAGRLKAFREASREKAHCFDINHVVQSYDAIFHEVKPLL